MFLARFIPHFYYILQMTTVVCPDCGCDSLRREVTISTKLNDCNVPFLQNQIQPDSLNDMSLIPGGTYLVGTNEPVFQSDGESPERPVTINGFYMDKYEVSNSKFKDFTDYTKYVTDAEKFNDSFIFQTFLSDEEKVLFNDYRFVSAPWWYKVAGVSWKHPHGPKSNLDDYWDHPVVHVSWNDAVAFCKWEGKRLPTEAEWEVACRGGKKKRLFPWGNKLLPNNKHRMNIWQGEFPVNNIKDDGYEVTCPIQEFRQNDYDMFNIIGNVWEWTGDFWDRNGNIDNPNRVKKGGSYLCHESYCYRYRCAARSQVSIDSSASNLGFRCAKDVKR